MDYKTKIEVDMAKAVRDLEMLKKVFNGNDKAVDKFTKSIKTLRAEEKRLNDLQRKSADNLGLVMQRRKGLIALINRQNSLMSIDIKNSRQKLLISNKELIAQQKLGAEIMQGIRAREKYNALKAKELIMAQKGLASLSKEYAMTIKISKAKEALNIAVKKGIISRGKANSILEKYILNIKLAKTHTDKFALSQSKAAKQSGMFSKALLFQSKLFHAAMLALSIKQLFDFGIALERTVEKLDLLDKKLTYFSKNDNAFESLKSKAIEVGSSIDDLGRIITRFQITTKGAFSTDEMLEWSDALVRSARATGTTTQEMNNALIQLSQSFSAGFLMGDEYRSISENLPMYKIALEEAAKANGTFTGSLKKMSSARLIDTDLMVQGFHELKRMVEGIPGAIDTIDASIQRFNVGWSAYIASIMEGSTVFKNFTNLIAGTLAVLSEDQSVIDGFFKSFPEMVTEVNNLANSLRTFYDIVTVAFKALTVFFVSKTLLGLSTAMASFAGATSAALITLRVAAGPLTFLATAVLSLGYAIGTYISKNEDAIEIEKQQQIELEKTKKKINEYKEAIDRVNESYGELAFSSREFLEQRKQELEMIQRLNKSKINAFNESDSMRQINALQDNIILLKEMGNQQDNIKLLEDTIASLILPLKNLEKGSRLAKIELEGINSALDETPEGALSDINKSFEKAREYIIPYNKEMQELQKHIKSVIDWGKANKKSSEEVEVVIALLRERYAELNKEKEKSSKVNKKIVKESKEMSDAMKALLRVEQKLRPETDKYVSLLFDLEVAYNDLEVPYKKYIEYKKELLDLQEQANKNSECESLKKEKTCLDNLAESFDDLLAATNDANDSIRQLNYAYKEGSISEQAYSESLKRINQNMLEAKANAGDLGAKFTLMWQEFENGFQENTKGLISDILKGEEDAFENFTDRILDMWIDMIAEMAVQSLMGNFNFNMNGSGQGGLGGTGLTSSSGSMLSTNDLISGAGKIFGGGSAASGATGVTRTMTTGFDAAGQPIQVLATPGVTGGTGITGGLGASVSNGMVSSGGAMLGGLVAGQVGGWGGVLAGGLTTVGSIAGAGALGIGTAGAGAVGSTLAAGGTAGAGMMAGAGAALGAVPVVGWVLAIASILSSSGVFGGDSDITPDMNLNYNNNSSLNNPTGLDIRQLGEEDGTYDPQAVIGGRFASFGFSTQHDAFSSEKDATDFANGMADRYLVFEDMIFNAFGEEVSKEIKDSMDNFDSGEMKFEDFSGANDFSATFQNIFNHIFKGVGKVANEEISKFEQVYKDKINQTGSFELGIGFVSAVKSIEDSGSSRSFENIIEVLDLFALSSSDLETQLNELTSATQLLALESNSNFSGFVAEVIKLGESSEITATRGAELANTLITVNKILENTNQEAYEYTISGSKVAETLSKMSGGLDAFVARNDYYYQNFFSSGEKAQDIINNTGSAIDSFNESFDTSVFSKQSLRSTIESLDLTTDSGRALYTELLHLAPTIVANSDAIKALEESAGAFHKNMIELSYELKGESDVSSTVRTINSLMEELSIAGNHASYSRDEFADLIVTLNGLDQETLDAEGSINGLARAMIDLDKIIADTQSEIDSLLTEMYGSSSNTGASSLTSTSTSAYDMAKKTYDIEIQRYEAAIAANETILNFLDSLKISELKNQSPYEQMMEASQLFSEAVASGDAQAATGYGKDYLQFAQKFYASSDTYTGIFDGVTDALNDMITAPGSKPIEPNQSSYSSGGTVVSGSGGLFGPAVVSPEVAKLLGLLNDMSLAKDESLWDIAQENGVDLKNLGLELIGSLEKINDVTIQSMAKLAIDNGNTSSELASMMGFEYERMISRLTDVGYTLKSIKEYDEKLAGYSDLTYNKMIEIAIGQKWSTNTLAAKYGATNEEVVSYLQTQGYTLSEIKTWNASVAVENAKSNVILKTIDQSLLAINAATYESAKEAGYGGKYSDNQLLQYLAFDQTNSMKEYLRRIEIYSYRTSKNLNSIAGGMGVPQYKQGTSFVPEDQYAFLHKGEAVIPEEYNSQLANYGVSSTPIQSNDEILEELRLLRMEVQSSKEITALGFQETIKNSERQVDIAEEENERRRINQ